MSQQQQIQPIFILPEGTQRTTGRTAQMNNIQAAKAVADTVRSTLGPKGMDKMIVDAMGDVIITNDGVTILNEMKVEHPAAKMIVEVAKTQEDEVGDGTTTAVVLTGEFLKNAEDLIEQNIHPTVITKGYRLASEKAIETLNKIAENVSIKDLATLKNIAITAMTGRGSEYAKEILSELLIKAIKDIAEEDGTVPRDNIKIEKKVGAGIESSELVTGIILDKERVHPSMPKQVQKAKIALLDCAIEIKSTETDSKIQITSPTQMQAFLDQEEKMLREMVDKIVKSGANVVITQKGIDDLAQHFLAQNNIYAVRRAKKSDVDKLALSTGGRVVSHLDLLSESNLGFAGMVEEKTVGGEQMTYVRECKNPKAVTILIRGGTDHIVDEVKRALEDALGDISAALRYGKVVAGAGAVEIEVAKAISKFANTLEGKEQLAAEAFAKSLEIIPRTLAESAGLDPIDKVTELKSAHDKGQKWAGIDVFTGKIRDSWKANVIEPLQTKVQAIQSATETAIMILRIDDVIAGGKREMPNMQGMPNMPM